MEPLEVGGHRARLLDVGVEQRLRGRHARGSGVARHRVLRLVGEEQEPREVEARVGQRPDLPVDERGDLGAVAEHVAEAVVAVADRVGERRRHRVEEQLLGFEVARAHALVDGLERARPALDLVLERVALLVAEADRVGVDAVQRREHRAPRRTPRSGITGSFSGDASVRIGSRHSPGTMFMAWNGDTSGGAPSSSK